MIFLLKFRVCSDCKGIHPSPYPSFRFIKSVFCAQCVSCSTLRMRLRQTVLAKSAGVGGRFKIAFGRFCDKICLKRLTLDHFNHTPDQATPRKKRHPPYKIRKAPDTFKFLRHVMRANLSVRPKCSHRCVSLKETPLKPVKILKHTTNNSAEQNAYENEMVETYRDLNCSGASPTRSSLMWVPVISRNCPRNRSNNCGFCIAIAFWKGRGNWSQGALKVTDLR